jgi:outer membrane protein TolC
MLKCQTVLKLSNKIWMLMLVIMVICPSNSFAASPTVLTLDDAVYLALRNNVALQSAELDRINQKYDLVVAKNQFEPQYTLGATASGYSGKTGFGNTAGASRSINFGPTASVSVENSYGTNISVSNSGEFFSKNNNEPFQTSPGASISVTQPLMRGFGRDIVEASLRNALDSEEINKISFRDTVISTIDDIISDYLALYQAVETLKIDNTSLKDNKTTLENDQLLVNAGRKASSELVADQSQIAQIQVTIQGDEENIRTARFKLLNDLGLNPDANIVIPENIDFDATIKRLTGGQGLPDQKTVTQLTLANDKGYISDTMTLNGTLQRSLISAKDAARWGLDLTASETIGTSQNAGDIIIQNGKAVVLNTGTNVGLTLDIPVDNVSQQQAILSARIALQQAEMNLQQEKRQLESNAEDNLYLIISKKQTLQLSIDALKIQQQNYENYYIKNQAGMITNYELLSEQEKLTSAQQTVVNNKIAYINQLVSFNQQLGTTLDRWGIKVRY